MTFSGPDSRALASCIGDADHRIISCDAALTEVLQRERGDIVGRHPLELTHELDRGPNARLLKRLARDGAAFSITKRYVRGDGSLIWVRNTVAPIRDGIGPARVCATSMIVDRPITSADLARNAEAARRLCATFTIGKAIFGVDLFGAPGAEILLALYTAELEGRRMTGDDIAHAVRLSVADTLALLSRLIHRLLVELEHPSEIAGGASYRIARRCEIALDALIASARDHAVR